MTTQAWMWTADGVAFGLVVLAGLADWRRGARRSLDAVGWVPWRGIQVAGCFALLVFTVLAIKL